MSEALQSRRTASLVAFMALALVLRLGAICTIGHPEVLRGEFEFKNDEKSYHRPAHALAETGKYDTKPDGRPTAYRPPGMIVPLAALYRATTPSPFVALGFVLFCSLAIVLVTRALAHATSGDERVANVAMLLVATLPTFLWTTSGIWSDAPAVLFMLVALLLLVRRHDGVLRWAAVGLAASVAYLTRPSAGGLFPVVIAAPVLIERMAARWQATFIVTVTLLLPIAAWGVRNWYALGEFFTGATVSGHTIWESNNPLTAGIAEPNAGKVDGVDLHAEAAAGDYLGSWVPAEYIPGYEKIQTDSLTELESYHRYVDLTTSFLRSNPRAAVRLVGLKLLRILSAESVAPSIRGGGGGGLSLRRVATFAERWTILLLGTMGLVMLYRTRSPARHYYAGFTVAGLLPVILAYPNARLMLPMTAVLLVPSALAAVRSWDGLRSRSHS